jgi:hypothetical protein
VLKIRDRYDYRRELCDALRSGKYKQGRGGNSILSNTQPCVLGVARILWQLPPTKVQGKPVGPYGPVGRMLGINPEKLWLKNDRGWSFKRLASWIERQP